MQNIMLKPQYPGEFLDVTPALAYTQGYVAEQIEFAKSEADNPHPPESENFEAWNRGRNDAINRISPEPAIDELIEKAREDKS